MPPKRMNTVDLGTTGLSGMTSPWVQMGERLVGTTSFLPRPQSARPRAGFQISPMAV